jgi:hypothetical protein
MGISQKLKAAMKLLKEIAHEYSTMTRKNKCIPGTRKKGIRISKKGKNETKKRVNFSTPDEPIEEPVEEPVEQPVEQPVEPIEEPENPFEGSEEPVEEPEGETNPLDEGLSKP